jgi:hypothetical protein
MKPFTYERAASPAEAAASAARIEGAKFVAGGTNLLDLMKLQIESPTHLIDVNGLSLNKIEPTAEGGLRIGALVRNTDLAADKRVRDATMGCCRALCWPARRDSYAIRRPLPAICCSEHVVPTSTTPINLATNDSPAVVVRPLMASIASTRLLAQAIPASQRTQATWPSPCVLSMLR